MIRLSSQRQQTPTFLTCWSIAFVSPTGNVLLRTALEDENHLEVPGGCVDGPMILKTRMFRGGSLHQPFFKKQTHHGFWLFLISWAFFEILESLVWFLFLLRPMVHHKRGPKIAGGALALWVVPRGGKDPKCPGGHDLLVEVGSSKGWNPLVERIFKHRARYYVKAVHFFFAISLAFMGPVASKR